MRRIGFVINSLAIGGAEKLVIDLINTWPEEDNISLLLFSEKNILKDSIKRKNIKIQEVPFGHDNFKILKMTIRFFLSNNIEYCFSHLERPNKISLFASKFTGTKVFPVVHNTNIYEQNRRKEWFVGLLYKLLAKKIVAISPAVENYLKIKLNISSVRIVLIENGIDFSRIKVHQSGNNPKQKTFFTIGRLVKAKGYDVLIEALGDPELLRYNWHLKMIGDGVERQKIAALINKHDLQDRISLLGNQLDPYKFITSTDIALMPSRREGMPIVLLEVLSQGIPVVCSNIESLTVLVQNNWNGFVFNSENQKDLKTAIIKILTADDQEIKFFSENARDAVKYFNIKRALNNYQKLIH